MDTPNIIDVNYEVVSDTAEAKRDPFPARRRKRKNKIVLTLAVEAMAILAIISVLVVIPKVSEHFEKKEYLEYIEETQGALFDSNDEAAMNLQEMILNDDAWYSDYDENWMRDCTLYTTENVDESFLKEAFGFDSEHGPRLGESSGISDYYFWGFIDSYNSMSFEKNEGSGVWTWFIAVYSDVSTEDQQLINATAQEIADKAIGSDADKVRTITEEINDMLSYEEVSGNNLSTVISTGKGCCRHYATLFYLACLHAGINSRIVAGDSENGKGHTWNIVEVDGKWYHVDPTWQDDNSGNWVLLGSETIKETHKLDTAYEEFDELYDISESDYAA